MNILHALNPYSSRFETIANNYPAWEEFEKLSIAYQAITILATAIITALSLTYYTASCFKTLVGRFRKIQIQNEENGENPLSETGELGKNKLVGETIEPRFWKTLFVDKNLHRVFEMVMKIKDVSHVEKATIVVNSYNEQTMDLSNKLDEGEKNVLIHLIANQITKTLALFKVSGPRSIGLPNQSTLKIYETENDGSCGFHALLGTSESGIYKCQDVLAERRKFCHWLRAMNHQNQLPDGIKNIIKDYIINYARVAPAYFKKCIQTRYETFANGYNQLSMAEKDALIEKFVSDVFVIEAYINNMEQQGTYLLQDELIMVGNFYGKRVILFQPDWSPGGQYPMCNTPAIYDADFTLGENDICVWYDGNHYERAEL
ncbi:MAG: OTU domain-containing protein [Chlamydiales bacterium]